MTFIADEPISDRNVRTYTICVSATDTAFTNSPKFQTRSPAPRMRTPAHFAIKSPEIAMPRKPPVKGE